MNEFNREFRRDCTTDPENIGTDIPFIVYGFMSEKDQEFFGFDNGKLCFEYDELSEEQTKKIYDEMRKYYE